MIRKKSTKHGFSLPKPIPTQQNLQTNGPLGISYRKKGGYILVRWEIVLKLISVGGPSIDNLLLHNEALLTKWIWRFSMEDIALWCRIIVNKYLSIPSG